MNEYKPPRSVPCQLRTMAQRWQPRAIIKRFWFGDGTLEYQTSIGLQQKKKMDGHNVAGYVRNIVIIPDGRFVCNEDSNGKLLFLDLKRDDNVANVSCA